MAKVERRTDTQLDHDPLLLPSEVAALFGVDATTVNRWVHERRLPSLRTLGGHHRFRRSDLERFLGAPGPGGTGPE